VKLLAPTAKLGKQWFCAMVARVEARVAAGEKSYGGTGKILI
jgi:hypothetical protein